MPVQLERLLELGLGELTRMPHKSVHGKDHNGKDVRYEGVSLIEVLKVAGVPSGDGLEPLVTERYDLVLRKRYLLLPSCNH